MTLTSSLTGINAVYYFLKHSIKVVAFVVVMMLLVSFTTARLNALKEQQVTPLLEGVSMTERIKQLDCLTKNIYWESAGEPFEGKVAVAQVTLNRAESGRFGKDICGVVYQRSTIVEKVICQFSWVCEAKSRIKPVYPKLYTESEEVAKKVLFENFRLPSLNDAMYFHATHIKPGWKKEKIAQIGGHVFYKD